MSKTIYHYLFNTVFLKSCKVFCAKPKEAGPINLNFCLTNKRFDITQIYNPQRNIEINLIRASIVGILSFNWKYWSVAAMAFHWRNDTIQKLRQLAAFIPKSVRPWGCLSFGLFVQPFFFFKLAIPFVGSLNKCHTR